MDGQMDGQNQVKTLVKLPRYVQELRKKNRIFATKTPDILI